MKTEGSISGPSGADGLVPDDSLTEILSSIERVRASTAEAEKDNPHVEGEDDGVYHAPSS